MEVKIDPETLKSLRLAKSWSQEELAEHCGLSLRTIQRMELDGNASLKSRRAVAEALEVDPLSLDPCPDPCLDPADSDTVPTPDSSEPSPGSSAGSSLLGLPDKPTLSSKTLNILSLVAWIGLVISGAPILVGLVVLIILTLMDPVVNWLPLLLASIPLMVIFIMCLALLQFFRYLGKPTGN